jgi:hypothetical protein
VRSAVADDEYRRNVADWTTQPSVGAGRVNRTRARDASAFAASTWRVSSVPKLLVGTPWSIDVSASASSVTGSGQVASIVHDELAALASALPAASVARTANVCGPMARPA